jgi:hypothetical protein
VVFKTEDLTRRTTMADEVPRPPPRPKWVKVAMIIVLVAVILVVVVAIADGEHGPGRHQPAGEHRGVRPPPLEQSA